MVRLACPLVSLGRVLTYRVPRIDACLLWPRWGYICANIDKQLKNTYNVGRTTTGAQTQAHTISELSSPFKFAINSLAPSLLWKAIYNLHKIWFGARALVGAGLHMHTCAYLEFCFSICSMDCACVSGCLSPFERHSETLYFCHSVLKRCQTMRKRERETKGFLVRLLPIVVQHSYNYSHSYSRKHKHP